MSHHRVQMKMKTLLTMAMAAGLMAAPIALGQTEAQSQPPAAPKAASQPSQADAYYYFMLGHVQEQNYELSNSADDSAAAIDSYKKALEIDPNSAVIKERLAEIYAKSLHNRDQSLEGAKDGEQGRTRAHSRKSSGLFGRTCAAPKRKKL